MRISDWSSDVCSSDLLVVGGEPPDQRQGSVSVFVAHAQRGDESLLRNAYRAVFAHPFLAFLLLLQKLPFARDIAAIAFGGHVLAQRRDRLACDHLAADRRLDRNLEQMTRDQDR